MVLFLVFSIPLLGLIVLRNRYPEFFHETGVWISYFRGTASFLVIVLPAYIFIRMYGIRYVVSDLYLHSLIVDFLLFLIPAVGAFFLLEYRSRRNEYGRNLFVRILAFFHGYFALVGVFAGYMYHPFYSGYRLFGYPLLIIILICVTTLSIYLMVIGTGWSRYLYLVLPLLLSALLASVPVLFLLSRFFTALIIFLFFLALGMLLFYIVQIRRSLPGM